MVYKRKEKIRRFLLFVSIYCTQTSFVLNMMFPGKINTIMITSSIMISIIIIGQYKIIQNNAFYILIFVSVCMGLTAITNMNFSGGYILVVMGYFQAMMFISAYDRQSFYEDYISIMKFMGIFSAVASILVYHNWLGINSLFPVLVNSVGDRYANFLFAIPSVSLSMFRLNGIWGEAGMFGVYLVFALVVELFYVKRNPKARNLAILLFVSILTLSATVFVVIAIMSVIYFLTLRNIDFHKRFNYLILAIPVVAIVYFLIMFFSPDAFREVFGKYDTNSISFIGRAAPILYNITKWINKPLFGNGLSLNLGETVEIMVFRGTAYRIKFNTTTTLIFLNYFGIPMFALHLFLIYRFARCYNADSFYPSRMSMTALLMIIILININTQDVELDQTMTLLLMSSFMKEIDFRGEERENSLPWIRNA